MSNKTDDNDEEYRFSEDEQMSESQANSIVDVPTNNIDFYKSNVYNDYIKLKLLIKGKISNMKLKEVNDTFSEYASKSHNAKIVSLRSTSRSSADRLIKCKLYDLCITEICYCIHNFFGPRSVFSIYHDESSDSAITFLQTGLSFRPDYNDEDIHVPNLQNESIIKCICSQEITDKTAISAVQEAILPTIAYINEIGFRMYGNGWRDLIQLLRVHTNAMSDENSTAIATSKLLFQELGVQNYTIWICFLHQISNCIEPGIKYLIWVRTQPWNVNKKDVGINRSKNISIIDLANKSSTLFRHNSDNERSRPHVMSTFILESQSTGNSRKYKRVVGNRTINLFSNVERMLERR